MHSLNWAWHCWYDSYCVCSSLHSFPLWINICMLTIWINSVPVAACFESKLLSIEQGKTGRAPWISHLRQDVKSSLSVYWNTFLYILIASGAPDSFSNLSLSCSSWELDLLDLLQPAQFTVRERAERNQTIPCTTLSNFAMILHTCFIQEANQHASFEMKLAFLGWALVSLPTPTILCSLAVLVAVLSACGKDILGCTHPDWK